MNLSPREHAYEPRRIVELMRIVVLALLATLIVVLLIAEVGPAG